MSEISWKQNDSSLTAFGRGLTCSCRVRTIANGLREYNQIVYSINGDGSRGVPCQPGLFPVGTWNVYKPIPKTDPYMAPFFIPTDAHAPIEEWTLIDYQDQVQYGMATGHFVEDYGFGLHHSTSATTLGCIKIESEADLRWLVEQIIEAQRTQTVTLEVTA